MATVTQDIVAPAFLKSFRLLNQEPQRFSTSEPMGILNFFENDVAITAIGVGDVKELTVRFDLPIGFIYVLKDIALTMNGVSTDVTSWLEGRLECFFGIDTVIKPQVKIAYPMIPAELRTAVSSLIAAQTYLFGGLTAAAIAAEQVSVPSSGPPWIFRGLDPSLSANNPTFKVSNRTASVGPWLLSYVARFDVFPLEQGDNSGLYWEHLVS